MEERKRRRRGVRVGRVRDSGEGIVVGWSCWFGSIARLGWAETVFVYDSLTDESGGEMCGSSRRVVVVVVVEVVWCGGW